MSEPTMSADLVQFLPTVLRSREFAANGILFGAEHAALMRLRWAVLDPRRHVMFVWQKSSPSFVAAAKELGASLFTNGPFTRYPHGRLSRSLVGFGADAARCVVRVPAGGDGGVVGRTRTRQQLARARVRHLQAPTPLGFVLGAHEEIKETGVSRPRVQWFGRGAGCGFDSYRIGRGDPVEVHEAIGGLFGGVRDYRPYTVDQFIRVGYWGLAPLSGDIGLERAGVSDAVAVYESMRPATAAGAGTCAGLILVVAGWSNTQKLTHLLSAVRVKDAVQFDGGDSLMFGSGASLMIGSWMPPWKRALQCWGIQFQPRQAGAGSSGPGTRSEAGSSATPSRRTSK